MTTSSIKMHRYGIPQPICQQIGSKTLTKTTKLGGILWLRASNDFSANHYEISISFNHSSIAIILMGKRELFALINLSSWCLMMVEWLFLAVPWGCLRFVIVVFYDHTHYFWMFVTFQYRGLHHLDMYCIIEAWLKSNNRFGCGYGNMKCIHN